MTIIDIITMILALGLWALLTFVVLLIIPIDDDDDENKNE